MILRIPTAPSTLPGVRVAAEKVHGWLRLVLPPSHLCPNVFLHSQHQMPVRPSTTCAATSLCSGTGGVRAAALGINRSSLLFVGLVLPGPRPDLVQTPRPRSVSSKRRLLIAAANHCGNCSQQSRLIRLLASQTCPLLISSNNHRVG